jgi:hypothetical protein
VVTVRSTTPATCALRSSSGATKLDGSISSHTQCASLWFVAQTIVSKPLSLRVWHTSPHFIHCFTVLRPIRTPTSHCKPLILCDDEVHHYIWGFRFVDELFPSRHTTTTLLALYIIKN